MTAYYFDHILPIFFVLSLGSIVCVPLSLFLWLRHKRTLAELELKHTLAERGMSATEICEVIEAGHRRMKEEEIAEAKLI
jgi:hypothetical protein